MQKNMFGAFIAQKRSSRILNALLVSCFRVEDEAVGSADHAADLVQLIESEIVWPSPG